MLRRTLVIAMTAAALTAAALSGGSPAVGDSVVVHRVCADTARWQCRAEILRPAATGGTDRMGRLLIGGGYTARQLESIYHTSAGSPASAKATIAVIDAYNYPHAASDLAHYRAAMGLRPCTVASHCLSIVNQNLARSPLPEKAPLSDDWTAEDALDLDMASAICPSCRLMLVEARNDQGNGLLEGAINAASRAKYVSMSWGGPDDGWLPTDMFTHSHTIYTAATGDKGYRGTQDFPSTFTGVVGVGGVSLASSTSSPTAWSGSGSSCSHRVPQPAPQAFLDTSCADKAASDVSALADPHTGVAVYDTSNYDGGWLRAGGTSAASPIVAALYALSGNHTDALAPYAERAAHPDLITDVTSGSTGSCGGGPLCTARVGWDGPTGLGMVTSPESVALPLGQMRLGGSSITVPVGLWSPPTDHLVYVEDIHGTLQKLASQTAQVTGLPEGLTAHMSGRDLVIGGTPAAVGSGRATVTMSGVTPGGRTATGVATVNWTVAQAFIPQGDASIRGVFRPGRKVWAHLPALHTNTATGESVTPTWTVRWILRGRVVHVGPTLRLPRGSRGASLYVRATASKSGYATRTLRSAAVTVR